MVDAPIERLSRHQESIFALAGKTNGTAHVQHEDAKNQMGRDGTFVHDHRTKCLELYVEVHNLQIWDFQSNNAW